MPVTVKRVYQPAELADGYRILVDGVWPRGVSKEGAAVAEWRRDLAPSRDLRRWFGHDPERWPAFRQRYWQQLDAAAEGLAELAERARAGRLTLVYGARERRYNNAVALRDYLAQRFDLPVE